MKVYLEAYGCTQNQGETREIGESLIESGWEIVVDPTDADLIVVGTCAVIEHTVTKILRRLSELRKLNGRARFFVTGCIPPQFPDRVKAVVPDAILAHPDERATRLLELGVRFNPKVLPPGKVKCMPTPVFNKVYYVIPISQGCLGSCTYCITKLVRGSVRSYPLKSIVSQVRDAVNAGYSVIRLSSQDTAAYGFDGGPRLPELMNAVSSLEGDFMVRVGMMNPALALIIKDDLIEAYSQPKIFKFIHIPVQSGSNAVLSLMKRGHDIEGFLRFHRSFKSAYPDSVVSTDIIVGYPGETEDDFRQSIELISKIKPDILNITRFSPRPGTAAWDMRKNMESGGVIKDRTRRLTKLHESIALENNKRYVGETMEGLAVEYGTKGGTMLRTKNYKLLLVDAKLPLGKWFTIDVQDATSIYLSGVLSS